MVFDYLRDVQSVIGQGNAEKGFHEYGDRLRGEHRAIQEALAAGSRVVDQADLDVASLALQTYYAARIGLIVTEASEAIEELRDGRRVDETYYPSLAGKPEGVPSEIADVVIRALDFAHEAGFDLATAIEEKLAYNQTRAFRHGRTF